MDQKPVSVNKDKKKAELHYEGVDHAALVSSIEQFFLGKGYKLEAGVPQDGTYGIGNKWLALLLGAFIKRFSVNVIVSDIGDSKVTVTMTKGASGASGGLIGVMRANKEWDALIAELS